MSKRDWEDKTSADHSRAFALPNSAEGIEVSVVHDERLPEGAKRRIIEIWTARRVYRLDDNRVCISVLDRETQREDPKHAFLNATLMGGQLKEPEGMSISHPLPLPGMSAVFEVRKAKARYGTTTKVERILMRVMMTNIQGKEMASEGDETTRVWKGWVNRRSRPE